MSEPQVNQTLNSSMSNPQFNRILSSLKDIFSNSLRLNLAEINIHANFLEMGLESLYLLQITTAIKAQFGGINVSFSLLLESVSTINDLAIYIAQQMLPEDPMLDTSFHESISPVELQELTSQQVSVEPSTQLLNKNQEKSVPSTLSARQSGKNGTIQNYGSTTSQNEVLLPENVSGRPTANTAIERLITQQLTVMSKQLDLLHKNSSSKKILAPSKTVQSAPLPEDKQLVETSTKASRFQAIQVESEQQLINRTIKPIPFIAFQETENKGSGTLSPRQQKHLDSLIARVVKRTQESKRLTQADRLHHANPRAKSGFRPSIKEMVYPIYPQRGSGARIWDIDGNEYIDISMGFGALLFGHSPSFVIEAIQEYIQQGIQLGPQSCLAGKVAELICDLTGQERAAFCNSGKDAVEGAIRIARATTGRSKIAFFTGSFHGNLDDVLVTGVANGEVTPYSIVNASGIPQYKAKEAIVLNYGSLESLDILKAHAHELAAILVEPVQSARPDFQPKEFLYQLRQLTQETGIVLIFDEVITGFRMHPGGIQALWDIQADITTYGKAVGAGLPIGVVAGKATFMDALDGGFWSYGDASFPYAETTIFGGTFFKHPLIMAAAWAALNHMKNSGPKLQEELTQKTIKLANTFNTYFEQKQLPIQVVHFGSLFRFAYKPTLKWMDLLFYHLLEKGIYALENRRLFLSTAHTDQDIEQLIQAVKESVVEMQEGGFLPPDPISTNSDWSINYQASASSNNQTDLFSNLPNQPSTTTSSTRSNKNISSIRNVPLIEAQKQLWFLAQMGDEASRAYNQSSTIHLGKSFNLEAARKAIQEVVNRHEALRTSFSPQGDYQQIHSTLTIDVPFIDFSTLDNSKREAQLLEFLAQEAQQTFDLEKGPLFRTQIIKLQEQHHLLVFTIHHIIADGWSFGLLQQELAAIYTAECQGTTCHLPQPMQLSEYIQWEARQNERPEMAKAEAYWLEQFANSVPILELPTDRPRPSVNTYNGTQYSITLSTSLYISLKKLSVELKSTLFTTLLASFMVLLHRLTGQNDIVVGIPSAGQLSLEGEYLVGHCVNLLPIRSQIVINTTFTKYLSSLKGVLSNAYDHQIYPFIKLVKNLSLPRDPSRQPLVTTLFNMDRFLSKSKSLGEEVDLVRNSTSSAISDISLDIHQKDNELLVNCEYNTDLFDSQTIQRWMGYWQSLLSGIVANPEQWLLELPMLTELEQQTLLVDWNDTFVEYPQQECIHQLFEAQVKRTPDAIAVVFESEQLTYCELNARANQLAHYLCSLGVGPEVLVGICVERSLSMVIGLLGILKAGGAYVPLDPGYPQERLAFMLENAQMPVLLTQQRLVTVLPQTQSQVVYLDAGWEKIAKQRTDNPINKVITENLAYVIYTSGSTGRPKGVEIQHLGLLNLVSWHQHTYTLTPADRATQIAGSGFDACVWELWPYLTVGASIHIPNEQTRLSPSKLWEYLTAEAITICFLPTPLAESFLEEQCLANLALRFLLTGGDKLHQGLWTALPFSLVNHYGPTENTVVTTSAVVAAATQTNLSPPIGRPIANTQIYLLDRHLQPVPVGVSGEIYISGVGLARGYLNHPELTAEKFIPNPLSNKSATRLYKTGDLARYLPNGEIEYIGRIDHQVKIRGFRIELGEIEAVISQHPGIRETVVVAKEDEPGQEQLVAYVVLQIEQILTITELRRFLESKLPNYMVPAAFVMLEALPLTPNGKVDRKALPAPDDSRPELEAVYQAPQTEVEKAIAKIWQELLHVEDVGIHDNFFELGGHSLLLVQVHSKLQNIFERDFPLVEMFQYPTISHLAGYLSQESNEQESITQHPHRPESRTTSVQRRKKARKEHRAAQKGVLSQ